MEHPLSLVPAGTPLFRTIFVFENYPLDLGLFRSSGLEVTMTPGSGNATHFPLSAGVMLFGDELHVFFDYEVARFDPGTIAEMAAQLESILRAMLQTPAPRLRDVTSNVATISA